MNFHTYPDREMLAMDLANRLAGELKTALLTEGRATLAVPGGTTPGPVFDALCAASLDWSAITVLPTDERWVPESDPRSNAALIRARLLTGRAAAARFVPLYAEGDPDTMLEQVIAQVTPVLPLSVLVLGMGNDMHTASLFPGADALEAALAADAPVLVAQRVPGISERRVTLSAPVLDAAMSKHLVIFGSDKRAALDRALGLPPEEAPVTAVLDDMNVHWAE